MTESHATRDRQQQIDAFFQKIRDKIITPDSFSYAMRFAKKRQQPRPFNNLHPYANSELHTSQFLTIPRMLDTISENASLRKQVLIINGPLGAGKSTTRKYALRELQTRMPEERIAVITAEMALREAVKDRKSGSFTKQDYKDGTQRFEEMIRSKISDPTIDCLIIEAPATGGYDIQGNGELLGMNRGTSAFLNLFGPEGEFRDLVDTYAIGVATDNMLDPLMKRFAVDTGMRRRRGEGGSYLGMFAAENDLYAMLAQDNFAFAKFLGFPTVVADNYNFYRESVTAGLLNWFYESYLKLPREHVLLCANERKFRSVARR